MAIIKEFREFFLRSVQVNTGAKLDQETGFPVSYLVNGISKFNRFLKGHYPSEGVMKKFTESITFKLNKEDRAQASQQGLTVIATDSNARDRTSNAIDGTAFTASVVPHQLPEVIHSVVAGDINFGSASVANGINIQPMTRTFSGLMRLIYKIAVSVKESIEIAVDGSLHLIGDTDTPGNEYFYGTNAIGTKGWFKNNNNSINSEISYLTPYNVTIATNQTVTGISGTVVIAGKYLIICEADISIDRASTINYRLKKGITSINLDRVIIEVTVPTNFTLTHKIYCSAIVDLIVGDVITLNVDSDIVTTITGRSINMIKISN